MKKEFIPYEQALELKELGFDEECLAYYHQDQMLEKDSLGIKRDHYRGKFGVLAPLYQQAFRFFREKYKIDSWISINLQAATNYSFSILDGSHLEKCITNLTTQEEAELACLKKLIEIAKNK